MGSINKSHSRPSVCIIIVSYNSKRWIQKCLDTLLETSYDNFQIIVIDNNSSDGSAEFIEKVYNDKVILIKSKKNLGWCGANNLGIKLAIDKKADYIMLLNIDIKIIDKQWLDILIDSSYKNPEYDILGCAQNEYDDPNCSHINEWTKYILYHGNRDYVFMWDKECNENPNAYAYKEEDLNNNAILDVYFVQGAAMLIKSELFNKIGYFNDKLFMFYDEVEFCRRAHALGKKIGLVCKSRICHYGGGTTQSSKKERRKRNFWFTRNKYIMVLSDTNKTKKRRFRIALKMFGFDIKDAFIFKRDVSDIFQLIHIVFDILINSKMIIDIGNNM